MRIADTFARGHGIAQAEIMLTRFSSNNELLTIRFDRIIPRYLAVLALGGLPARNISVTASAWRQGAGSDSSVNRADTASSLCS